MISAQSLDVSVDDCVTSGSRQVPSLVHFDRKVLMNYFLYLMKSVVPSPCAELSLRHVGPTLIRFGIGLGQCKSAKGIFPDQ